jgi:hypothetical protein
LYDQVEETEDGQKIRFHYEKVVNEAKDEFSISVSSDVLDTAEDMAEAMADIPAKVSGHQNQLLITSHFVAPRM